MIKVIGYDPIQNIISLDILGQQTQATPPQNLYTQSDWVVWLATIIQPVVDSLIRGKAYDPMQLVQMGDLASTPGILTNSEVNAISILFPDPQEPPK